MVSHDIILLPFVPVQPTLEQYTISFAGSEKMFWKGSALCPPKEIFEGVLLDNCKCKDPASVTREVLLSEQAKTVSVEACAYAAGGDGVYLKIRLDDYEDKQLIKSGKCETKYFDLGALADGQTHSLTIEPEVYGDCDQEIILIKTIRFSEEPELAKLNGMED